MTADLIWDWQHVLGSLPLLIGGVLVTLQVCAAAAILTVPVSLVGAAAKGSRFRVVRGLASLYVAFFISTPFLVQLVWFFFVLPIVTGYRITSFQAAVLSLALYIGAYQTEVVRAGLQSLPLGQHEAAASLGMTRWQAYAKVLLPQAIERMIPPSMSMLIILIKESAVVSAVAVTDLMFRATTIGTRTFRPMEPLTFAALAYIAIILPLSIAARHLHRRQRAHFS